MDRPDFDDDLELELECGGREAMLSFAVPASVNDDTEAETAEG